MHAPMHTRTSPFGVAPSHQSLGTRPRAPHVKRACHGQSTTMARRSPARRSGRGKHGDAVGFTLVRDVYRVDSGRRGRSEGHDATSPRWKGRAHGAAVAQLYRPLLGAPRDKDGPVSSVMTHRVWLFGLGDERGFLAWCPPEPPAWRSATVGRGQARELGRGCDLWLHSVHQAKE
jgi:hypothetical protein